MRKPIAILLALLLFSGLFTHTATAQVTVSGAHASSIGSFPTVKEAFDAINLQDQTGFNILVGISDNTTETATAVLNQGAWATLTVYPTASGKTISGTIAGALISLNGADNVTIDGSYNGITQSLTFSNYNATTSNSTIVLSNTANNNTIKNCRIYSKFRSIFTTSADNTLIEGNDIFGDVLGNTLLQQSGIYLTTNTTNAKVRRNNIHDIYSTIVSNGISWGIYSGSNSTSDTEISNNVIYAIKGVGNWKSYSNPVSGICISNGGNLKIYNNSIYLSGNFLGQTSISATTISSCIFVGSTVTGLDIRNNILFNAIGRNPASPSTFINTYQIYSAAPKTAFTNINANDYYFTDQPDVNEYVGNLFGVVGNIANLDDWKTATGQDAGSYSTDPHFTSATNLKPIVGNFLIGEYIAAITNDYEGVTRNNPPHIGAYEGIPAVWLGGTSTDWATPGNWENNVVPVASDNVAISPAATYMPHITTATASPAVCNSVTIQDGASLTIAAGNSLTVSGSIANATVNSGLVIESNASGTGSLIATNGTTGSGTALIERYMPELEWHIVSSPAGGQTVTDFIGDNKGIPYIPASGLLPDRYGMMDYDPALDKWNDYFTDATATSEGLLGIGKGYMVRVMNVVNNLRFKGAINPTYTTSVSADWNCIGNPFTSAIRINTAAGSDNFMAVNSGLFDDNNKALYFWNQTNSSGTGSYDVVNLADDGATYAQVGQGFFMKAKGAGDASFTTAMQTHQTAAPFKAATVPYPRIRLIAAANNKTVSTDIKFIEGTQKGLDPGYDAGLFTTDKSFSIYTKLVEDNGIQFQLQCLPPNQYNNLVIPIGLDSKSGGEIVLSVETVQLDPTCKVILEDKLTHTFTDLCKNSYKAAVEANTAGTGRFFLHTGDIISGLEDQVLADGKLTAYAIGNKEIRIIGEVGEGVVATLVNGLGQVVLTQKLGAGNLNIIGLPNLISGVYLLNINDKGTPQTIKMMVRK